MPRPVTENELHALVDDQLAPDRVAVVQAWLRSHPEDAQRVAAWQRQRTLLQAHFAPALHEPLPPRLLHAATGASPEPPVPISGRRARHHGLWPMAASVVMAVAGGLVGWNLHGMNPSAPTLWSSTSAPQVRPRIPALARDAAIAYAVFAPDQGRPVEIAARHEAQLVQWLSKRMGAPMNPPDLQGLGYQLEGGRLLPGSVGPVAQFMYADREGMRLTVYVRHEDGVPPTAPAAAGSATQIPGAGFQFARDGAVNIFYWVDAGLGYAITSWAGRDELARVSEAVYQQLSARPGVRASP